ncbi:MAG: VCBS repeat-containing protein, partial [Thermodesulfovibrionales bacterium]|nr:VCBS repeat-containing protein [Thermodesulfovibrionales bacterium]
MPHFAMHKKLLIFVNILFFFLTYSCGGSGQDQQDFKKEILDISFLNYGQPYEVACADFNKDGYNDIALAVKYSGVHIYLNDLSGAIDPLNASIYSNIHHPTSLKTADFNGDGNMDVIALVEDAAYIMLGKGDGTFSIHTPYYAGPSMSLFVQVGDLNNDGRIDFVLCGATDPNIYIYFNESKNGYINFRQTVLKPTKEYNRFHIGYTYTSIYDIDGDGRKDILIVDSLNSILWIGFNEGDDNFTFQNLLSGTVGSITSATLFKPTPVSSLSYIAATTLA